MGYATRAADMVTAKKLREVYQKASCEEMVKILLGMTSNKSVLAEHYLKHHLRNMKLNLKAETDGAPYTVLELGCGTGADLLREALAGARVLGVDMFLSYLLCAKKC
jgi:SAM-dependent methyltransferase